MENLFIPRNWRDLFAGVKKIHKHFLLQVHEVNGPVQWKHTQSATLNFSRHSELYVLTQIRWMHIKQSLTLPAP